MKSLTVFWRKELKIFFFSLQIVDTKKKLILNLDVQKSNYFIFEKLKTYINLKSFMIFHLKDIEYISLLHVSIFKLNS